MSGRVVVLLCTLVASAFLLTACGNLTKSPSEGLNFTAPARFVSKMSVLGMMQFWMDDRSDQFMVLMRLPSGTGRDAMMQNAKLKGSEILQNRAITICGRQPARFVRFEGTRTSGQGADRRPIISDMVTKDAGDGLTAAMYVYPKGAKPDPAAEQAITHLCESPAAKT